MAQSTAVINLKDLNSDLALKNKELEVKANFMYGPAKQENVDTSNGAGIHEYESTTASAA